MAPSPISPLGADLVIDAQSAEDIALFEELATWVEHLGAPDGLSWRQAIRERQQSFDVFRKYHPEELRSAPLAELPYGTAIRRSAARYGLDPLLLASIVEVESSFDPKAVSRRGARGLMQLMPATAGATSPDDLADPERNLDAGARYLRRLLKRYDGDLVLALAAYNAGPTNVRRYDGVPPFRETRRYVEKVLGIYVKYHRRVWQATETAERFARVGRQG